MTDEKKEDESIVEETIEDLIPGFGKFVKHLKKQSPELQKRIDETDLEIRKRLAEGGSPQPKITYSCRYRPLARQGTQTKKTAQKNRVSEPVVDVFEEVDAIRIIAELPGIREEDIRITTDDLELTIEAEYQEKHYRKEIQLPFPAEESSHRFKNGILEIEMNKDGS